MGASNSHEAVPQDSPPDSHSKNRILSIDPRSPTAEISRTPIVVEKTPENFLHDPLDPRSPTIGIDRTPLTIYPPQSKPAEQVVDVVAQKLDMDDIDTDNEYSSKPCDCDQQMKPQDVKFDALYVTGIEDISLDDFPSSESTRLMASDEQEKQMLELTDKVRLKKKKKPKQSQPKELFPGKKSSDLREVTRSPLSTRTLDMNSPLQIIQRKQVKDIDKKMTCAQENAMSRFVVREKENM